MGSTNWRVRLVRGLIAQRKERYREGAFIVQGEMLVREALEAGASVRFLLERDDGAPARAQSSLVDAFPGVDCFVVEPGIFDALNDTSTPQGSLAVVEMPARGTFDASPEKWYVVADRISDPGNLGTILRSAEASGATGVIVTDGTADPFSPKSVRASAGAILYVPIYFVSGLSDVADSGIRLVGTTSRSMMASQPVWDADVDGCIGLVFGNEAHGIVDDAVIGKWIRIPHLGRAESLNVAMAASIVSLWVAHVRSKGRLAGNYRPAPAGPSD